MKNTKITERVSAQFRAEFFDILNHPNFSEGSQVISWGSAEVMNPTNPNYSQLSNPAAYAVPTATSAGGAICNPSGEDGSQRRFSYRRVLPNHDRDRRGTSARCPGWPT